MSVHITYHSQPKLRGVIRRRLSSYVLGEIEDAIADIAKRYHVKPSWVAATILADALGIRKQPDYHLVGRKLKVVKGGKVGRSNR